MRVRRGVLTGLLLFSWTAPMTAQTAERPRVRDAGVVVGLFEPGTNNSITDVAGVRVGHATLHRDGSNTGVTAILPPGEDWFRERVPAAIVVGNGFGKLIGTTQVRELGELETPILLTCTLCVWRAADAMVEWLLGRPGMEAVRSINPVVGETNDGGLNDIRSRRIEAADVVRALETASAGHVEEGAVGAGAGTVAFGWKGGIGTASRVTPGSNAHTVGVLVQSNFGGVLTIGSAPVGRELGQYAFRRDVGGDGEGGTSPDGSIMMVVATDAPLDARNLERLATRALVGLARTGATMSNGSGDYVIAFSTATGVRRTAGARLHAVEELGNDAVTALFQAVAEATEEAIYNSLFKATTTTGPGGNVVEALPLEATLEVLRRHGVIR
jgi:D-aminopeptidase